MPTSLSQDPLPSTQLEIELLLCCARTCMDTARVDRLRGLLREDINWEYVIRTAQRHGIIPLLSKHLSLTCPEAVPQAILDQLHHLVYANTLHSLFLTRELLKLLTLFETHNIPTMPYKGPVLATTVYGNLALRQFSDLDILVPEQDVLRVKALLIARGYRPWLPLTDAQESAHLKSYHAYTFVRYDRRVSVDVHWRFEGSLYAFPLDLKPLWQRLEMIPFVVTTIRNPPPEDLLLLLCAHGTKDGWAQLKWICDINELCLVHPGMDWERVMEHATMLYSERMLFLGLLLAHDLLGATLPENVLQKIQTAQVVRSLASRVRKQLFSETAGIVQRVERDILHFRVMQCSRDKMSYVFHNFREVMTPNESDQACFPLPSALSSLHYALRPVRLISAYGPDVVRHFLQPFLWSCGILAQVTALHSRGHGT